MPPREIRFRSCGPKRTGNRGRIPNRTALLISVYAPNAPARYRCRTSLTVYLYRLRSTAIAPQAAAFESMR